MPGSMCSSAPGGRVADGGRGRWCAGVGVLLSGVLMVVGCSPALNWRQVPLAGGAQVLFPCKAAQRERSGVPLAGRALSIAQASCEAGGMTFVVMTVALPAPDDGPGLAQALVDAAAANVDGRVSAADGSSGRAAAPEDLASAGRRATVAGRRSDGEPVRLELLVLQRGSRLYQAAVVAPAPAADAVTTFFDGVRDGVTPRGGAVSAPSR